MERHAGVASASMVNVQEEDKDYTRLHKLRELGVNESLCYRRRENGHRHPK
jgi:hypothetical protein